MLNSKTKTAAAVAGALLLLAGCGQESRVGDKNTAVSPVGDTSAAGSAANLAQALSGNYSGDLEKSVNYYNQPQSWTPAQCYNLAMAVVACPQNPQAQCMQATFTTSGAGGSANHTVYMSYLGYITGGGGAQIHVLQQYPASKIPDFLNKIVALELRVALVGTTIDRAQSKTRVMDCVLSQGAYNCRSDISDVRFVGSLRKS